MPWSGAVCALLRSLDVERFSKKQVLEAVLYYFAELSAAARVTEVVDYLTNKSRQKGSGQ